MTAPAPDDARASIEVEDVTRDYDSLRAVDGVTFRIDAGEIVGFLGPNGAGKSTLLKMLASYLEPSAGRIRIAGVDTRRAGLEARARAGYLPEHNSLYERMRVDELLRFAGAARGLRGAELDARLEWVAGRCDLGAVRERRLTECSKGFRQRVGLAAALIHDPPVLLLDEPTHGLDPLQVVALRDFLHELRDGRAILFSSHILAEVVEISDRLIVIDRGRLCVDASVESLRADARRAGRTLEREVLARIEAARAETDPAAVERPERDTDHANASAERASQGGDEGIVTGLAGTSRRDASAPGENEADTGRTDASASISSEADANTSGASAVGARPAGACGATTDEDASRGEVTGSPRTEPRSRRPSTPRGLFVICRRELTAAWDSPIAVTSLTAFWLLALTRFLNDFFLVGRAETIALFDELPLYFALLLPALSMRSWSEERASRTFEFLVSLPLRPAALVLGKWLASLALLALALAGTTPVVAMLVALGEPDLGWTAAGYVGAFVLGAWMLALGAFLSALAREQIVALLATVFVIALALGLGEAHVVQLVDGWSPGLGLWLADTLSALPPYRRLVGGELELSALVWFGVGTAVALAATTRLVARERA